MPREKKPTGGLRGQKPPSGRRRNSREGLQLDSNLFAAARRCQQNFGGSRLCETAQRGELIARRRKERQRFCGILSLFWLAISFHLPLTTLFSVSGSFAGPRGPFPPPRPSQAKRREGKRNERLTMLTQNLSG